MDSVPDDFCARVAAAWKACLQPFHCCRCKEMTFAGSKWEFSMAQRLVLYILAVDRKWKYGFGNPNVDETDGSFLLFGGMQTEAQTMMSMEELMQNPAFKGAQIGTICCLGDTSSVDHLIDKYAENLSDVDEKVLKFASYLSNQPRLDINSLSELYDAIPESMEGALIGKWLEERSYSGVFFMQFTSTDRRLLQSQFYSNFPFISIYTDYVEDRAFVERSLASGHLQHFYGLMTFSFEIMKGIIDQFQRNPKSFAATYCTSALYDRSTPQQLDAMHTRTLCRVTDLSYYFEPFTRENERRVLAIHREECYWDGRCLYSITIHDKSMYLKDLAKSFKIAKAVN